MSHSLKRWHGKVALVTGASSGIGKAIALSLGGIGMKVAIAGRRKQRLEAFAQRLKRSGVEVLTLLGDQLDPATNRALVSSTINMWGKINVLVNNAGMSGGRGFCDADFAQMEACWDLNLRATAICMHEALHAMQGVRDAAIINISSLTAHRLVPNRDLQSVAYAASKHALRALTEGVRIELAAQQSPIKIAHISPGLVDTKLHAAHWKKNRIAAYGFQPLSPDDIAQSVLYVLSTPRHVQVSDILIRSTAQVF